MLQAMSSVGLFESGFHLERRLTSGQKLRLQYHGLLSLLSKEAYPANQYSSHAFAKTLRKSALLLAHDRIHKDLIGTSPAWVFGSGQFNDHYTYEVWWKHLIHEASEITHPVHLKVRLDERLDGSLSLSKRFLRPPNSASHYPKPYVDMVTNIRKELASIRKGHPATTIFGLGIKFADNIYGMARRGNIHASPTFVPPYLAEALMRFPNNSTISTHSDPSCTQPQPTQFLDINTLPNLYLGGSGMYYFPRENDRLTLFSLTESEDRHMLSSSIISRDRTEPLLLQSGDTLINSRFPNITVISPL